MTSTRIDPQYPRATVLATKISPPDAERIRRLAEAAGLSRSAYIRTVLLDALEREEDEPLAASG